MLLAVLGMPALACPRQPALASGDEGHKVVGLLAQTYLTPEAGKKVNALIAADPDPLTAHDIASESTWADTAALPVRAVMALPDKPSLAVLPFDSSSDVTEHVYFA